MSVRFDADGKDLTSTLSLGSLTQITISLWANIKVNRGTWTTIFSVDNGSGSVLCIQAPAGNNMRVYDQNNDVGATQQTLTVGTWYHIWLVRNGTAGEWRWRPAGSSTYTAATWTAGNGATLVANTLRLGESPWGAEWMNGSVCNVKLWSGVNLAADELEHEGLSYLPHRTTNLVAWYPLTGLELADLAGGHTLTGGAGAAVDEGPPIGWGGTRVHRHVITPAGGATHEAQADLAVSAAITSAATATKSSAAAVDVTAGITSAGAATKLAAAVLDASATVASQAVRAAIATADLTATANLAAETSAARPMVAAVEAVAAITSQALAERSTTAAMDATATLTTATIGVRPASADVALTASIVAAVGSAFDAGSATAATASITSEVAAIKPAASTLATTAAITSAATVIKSIQATLGITATITSSGGADEAEGLNATLGRAVSRRWNTARTTRRWGSP
ncbi:LamG-like jellyroll fold domain-containing protein [Nonomuraea sp. NPDC050790]|uniref:LamG-like jellyroll fold domain-containing protein n=1 Tax=Nonomuraea sp. NPDC050790 TaxID=3364371 RepID=UPI0037B99861